MVLGFDLLVPSFWAFKRKLKKQRKILLTALILGAILFAGGVYYGLYRFLSFIAISQTLGPLGPLIGGLLVNKFLEMIYIALFFMVLFSSIISAFSAFYLDSEIFVLFASPLSATKIFWSRFWLMLFDSSWMAMAFFLPIFFAFATTAKAPWWAYLVYPLFVAVYLLLPNIIGAITALTLGSIFPIRQMKKVFQFLSVVVLGSMVFFFRFLEPEKLLNPSSFGDISRYILGLQSPFMKAFPSSWMVEASKYLFAGKAWQGFAELGYIFFYAVIGFGFILTFSKFFYRTSWQTSVEAIENQVLGLEWARKLFLVPLRFFPIDFRVVAEKEITVFLRDPSIFSQVFMMIAIVFVYGYNLTIIPLKEIPVLYSGEVNDSLVYFNGPFIGFIMSAIAMRFVYPTISLEGKAFWVVKAAPIKPGRMLKMKFYFYLPWILVLGLVLCYISNSVFKVTTPLLFYISFINVILMAIVITALAVGLGAVYADFSSDNPLKVAGSFGGFVFMIFCGIFVFNLLLCEAYPMYRFYLFRHYPHIELKGWILTGISIFLLLVSTGAWIFIPLQKGREAIDRYEPE